MAGKKQSFASIENRFWEAFIKASGFASTLLVLLIIFFLFSEGLSLFSDAPVEQGLTVAVHPQNPVNELNAEELQQIFEGKTESWESLGGMNLPLQPLHLGNLERYLKEKELITKSPEELIGEDFSGLQPLLDSLLNANQGMILAFQERYLPGTAKTVETGTVALGDVLAGSTWEPAESPLPLFGILPLLWGTILVTLVAIAISLLFGPPVAIYLAEIADARIRSILKPTVELLAGIPSVVIGFLGLVVIVPFIRNAFNLDSGSTALAGSILLALVALPTIISVAEDAIRSVPPELKEASLGLGATQWQTIRRVVVPYAQPGILAAIILGVGRIVGETMIVLMVTGNNPQLVGFNVLASVRTMSAAIAAEMGEAPQGGMHYKALFVVGSMLFLLTFLINLLGEYIKGRSTSRT